VHPSPADLKFGREFLGSPSHVWVAVHCGSGSPKKNWPVGFFAEICQWLSFAFESKLAVICGEADGAVTAEFLQQTRGIVSREARGLSLVQLAGVLANCHLYLGNDSGITHLAAAVGIPTVALWWPGSSPVWRPVGANVRVIPFNQASPALVRQEVEKLLKSR
jgi:ADP-heptose:LPS heptosyltransferase